MPRYSGFQFKRIAATPYYRRLVAIGAIILRVSGRFRRRTGSHHSTDAIPFILSIHANYSSSANWVRVSLPRA